MQIHTNIDKYTCTFKVIGHQNVCQPTVSVLEVSLSKLDFKRVLLTTFMNFGLYLYQGEQLMFNGSHSLLMADSSTRGISAS